MTKEVFAVQNWNTPPIKLYPYSPGGMTENSLFIEITGSGKLPSPPVNGSRVDVYVWLIDCERQNFHTRFSDKG